MKSHTELMQGLVEHARRRHGKVKPIFNRNEWWSGFQFCHPFPVASLWYNTEDDSTHIVTCCAISGKPCRVKNGQVIIEEEACAN